VIRGHVEIRNAQIEHALVKQFHEELKKFEQRQRDEDCGRQADALIPHCLQAAEEKLKGAKGINAETIFDIETEASGKFHIVIPARENIPGILIVGNQTPPPIPPIRPGATVPPNNINKRFNDFEYYSNFLQLLGSLYLVTKSYERRGG
jgi:hypothetical protein